MAVGAFTSIVLFKGFSNYMMDSFELSVTRGQFGHIQVAKNAVWDRELPSDKVLGYISDSQELRQQLEQIPGVVHVGPRANTSVLLTNGDQSIGAWAIGFDPVVESNVEEQLAIKEGAGFTKTQNFEILVSSGLQKQLHLKIGQSLTLVSQTLTGSMSSIEPEVRGIVSSGVAETDNQVVYLPLPAVQKLLGTTAVERLSILLKQEHGKDLEKVRSQVNDMLKSQPEMVAKTFREVVTLFQQTSDFYAVQNLVVESILAGLIFFGILNTVGMSIYERIGEIGTMRALGDQRGEVVSLLLLEALLLGIFSSLIGAPFAAAMAGALSALDIPMLMPGASAPMPFHLHPVMADYLEAAFVVGITCLVSSLWPAQKAVRLSIVDALRANS
jgi:putative ABC transport system permease protein